MIFFSYYYFWEGLLFYGYGMRRACKCLHKQQILLYNEVVRDGRLAHRLLIAIPNILLHLFRNLSQHILDNLQPGILRFQPRLQFSAVLVELQNQLN